jgi:hypothetical protein
MSLLLSSITLPWRIFCVLLNIAGRLLGVLFGLFLLTTGLGLTLFWLSMPIGIAVAILGLLLLIRSIF